MSAEEQDKKAVELFVQIADIMDSSERKAGVKKAEELYLKIINDYPRAALAEECYWRLVIIYVRDSAPPQYEKAEQYHKRFIKLYPASQFRREIEDSISKAYFMTGRWENLVAFHAPAVKRYIETGKLDRPHDMYYYAEGKKNLGDLVEAEKGYKIVFTLFPSTREGGMAKQRLDDLITQKNLNKNKK